jgi:hypothetical protein
MTLLLSFAGQSWPQPAMSMPLASETRVAPWGLALPADTLRFGANTQPHPLLKSVESLIAAIQQQPNQAQALSRDFVKQYHTALSPKVQRAFAFSDSYIHNKLRKDGSAVANHGLRIMAELMKQGQPEHYWTVALLHDIPEDYGGLLSLIKMAFQFGLKTALDVLSCTENLKDFKISDWSKRKQVGLKRFIKIRDEGLFDLILTEKRDSITELARNARQQPNPKQYLDSLDLQFSPEGYASVMLAYSEVAKRRQQSEALRLSLNEAIQSLLHLYDSSIEKVQTFHAYQDLKRFVNTLLPVPSQSSSKK